MYIGIDLGSTNIKAALYDSNLTLVDRKSRAVEYIRENGFVEFGATEYCENLLSLLKEIISANGVKTVKQLSFTGQAESLIVADSNAEPLMNAISWMDERSAAECEALSQSFTLEECEAVTGQLAILPTWPATKILWLKNNRPEIYNNAAYYFLLKDYVVYWLTGVMKADMSIATFSFYFDIHNKCYWEKMLRFIGVKPEQLPPLAEPCTVAGKLLDTLSAELELENCPDVNIGTLDHFAGMIGTGNISEGKVTLSTGTVMAMAAFSKEPAPKNSGIAMHYGFLPDTHIMLPVAESGGVCLEWFKTACLKDASFKEIDETLEKRGRNSLIFLPYIVGTSAPEFDSNACGLFYGLRAEHDAFDMAYAVMEGVAFVLKKNCEAIKEKGTALSAIIATGGGAKSDIWCQLQADITGLPILIPAEKEAACLGAAIIGAVSDGAFNGFAEAVNGVEIIKRFEPQGDNTLEEKFRKFNALYKAMINL